MATYHIVDGLTSLATGRVNFVVLFMCMMYSSWTEQLQLEEYRELSELVVHSDADGIVDFAQRLLPHYQQVWEQLGKPESLEEWQAKETEDE